MYKHEIPKSRKSDNNIPSFSSTLLDQIYRSIDGNAEDFMPYGHKNEIASFRRVEKWMKKDDHHKNSAVSTRKPTMLPEFDTSDLMFFSSTSSSSDSSGALSSSDTEFFGSSTTKPKVSCFSTRPKPVRTVARIEDHHHRKNRVEDDDLMKSKSRALKIYANLKKVKQPISPGGRLTSFINSLFSNANGKKSKNQESKSPTTCSSASSYSRSCLSKYSPNSREKMRNGAQRTVRFHPVSVIVDEDSRPCGQRCTYDQHSDKATHPPSRSSRKVEDKRVVEFSSFRKIHDPHREEEEEEEEEDCMSDSSSDLFELDHLSLFGDSRFCQELPVYETTHFDTNRAIASGLIR